MGGPAPSRLEPNYQWQLGSLPGGGNPLLKQTGVMLYLSESTASNTADSDFINLVSIYIATRTIKQNIFFKFCIHLN